MSGSCLCNFYFNKTITQIIFFKNICLLLVTSFLAKTSITTIASFLSFHTNAKIELRPIIQNKHLQF